jgi:hypothetical protein
MKFNPIDFNVYNKPPYLPQYLARGETKKLMSFDDEKFKELDALIDKTSEQYDLDKAKGILLDRIGKLVNKDRNGDDDELYRLFIRLKIILNTTTGSVNDIIKVIKFIFHSEVVHITQNYPAGITILHDGESPPIDFNSIISQVVAAGVAYDTKELFYFFDDFVLSDYMWFKILRKDTDVHGIPIKYNSTIKYDGKTTNKKWSFYGYYNGGFRHNGSLKYNGTGKTDAQYKVKPPFRHSSGIVDVLEVSQLEVFSDQNFAKLYFDGSVKHNGANKYNGLSQYSINDPKMFMQISRDHADQIVHDDNINTSVVIDIQEDTKKDIRYNGYIKYNAKSQYTKDYVDRVVIDAPLTGESDNVEITESSFFGFRKHQTFNGVHRHNGAIKYDGMVLIPLG